MNYRHETRVRTVELLSFVCVIAVGGATLLGCRLDILDGLESPCSRAGLDCEDGNPCTRDYCTNYTDLFGTGVSGPMCTHEPTNDGALCTFAGISGECRGGLCGAEQLCEGVVCEDYDPCTDDTCEWNGTCAFTPISCDDGNDCTVDSCDGLTGMCDFTRSAEDETWCILDGPSALEVGGCEAGVCVGPCDSASEEESPCPVEFPLGSLVCCAGGETCLIDCPSDL